GWSLGAIGTTSECCIVLRRSSEMRDRKHLLLGLGLALPLCLLLSSYSPTFARVNRGASQSITVTYMASGTYDRAAHDVARQLKKEGINVTVAAFPWAVLRQKNTTAILY